MYSFGQNRAGGAVLVPKYEVVSQPEEPKRV